jgi:hypothetical protein
MTDAMTMRSSARQFGIPFRRCAQSALLRLPLIEDQPVNVGSVEMGAPFRCGCIAGDALDDDHATLRLARVSPLQLKK